MALSMGGSIRNRPPTIVGGFDPAGSVNAVRRQITGSSPVMTMKSPTMTVTRPTMTVTRPAMTVTRPAMTISWPVRR
jgi:hypothetical protein